MDIKAINAKKLVIIDPKTVAKCKEFTTTSECITSFIVEKLISLTFTQSERNDIDRSIPDHCFEWLKKNVDNYVRNQFICYDRDDFGIVQSNIKKSLTINPLQTNNPFDENLEECQENNKSMQSLEHDHIYNPTENNENIFYNNSYFGLNDWTTVDEPVNI